MWQELEKLQKERDKADKRALEQKQEAERLHEEIAKKDRERKEAKKVGNVPTRCTEHTF